MVHGKLVETKKGKYTIWLTRKTKYYNWTYKIQTNSQLKIEHSDNIYRRLDNTLGYVKITEAWRIINNTQKSTQNGPNMPLISAVWGCKRSPKRLKDSRNKRDLGPVGTKTGLW